MKNGKKGYNDLTKEDVLRIWTMRAGGIMNHTVAKEIGCPEYVSSDVVNKGIGPKVPIPPKIREAALTYVHKRTMAKKVTPAPALLRQIDGIESIIPNFVIACIGFERYRTKCLAAGISEDTLNLMMLAAKEQVSKEGA